MTVLEREIAAQLIALAALLAVLLPMLNRQGRNEAEAADQDEPQGVA